MSDSLRLVTQDQKLEADRHREWADRADEKATHYRAQVDAQVVTLMARLADYGLNPNQRGEVMKLVTSLHMDAMRWGQNTEAASYEGMLAEAISSGFYTVDLDKA